MKKIKQWIIGLQDWIDCGIDRICYSMSPLARLLSVLAVGFACGIAFIYIMIASIYNIGKRDAENKFIELQHIKSIELQNHNDSINILNQKEYEYEQSR
jgi:hypothetical protein